MTGRPAAASGEARLYCASGRRPCNDRLSRLPTGSSPLETRQVSRREGDSTSDGRRLVGRRFVEKHLVARPMHRQSENQKGAASFRLPPSTAGGPAIALDLARTHFAKPQPPPNFELNGSSAHSPLILRWSSPLAQDRQIGGGLDAAGARGAAGPRDPPPGAFGSCTADHIERWYRDRGRRTAAISRLARPRREKFPQRRQFYGARWSSGPTSSTRWSCTALGTMSTRYATRCRRSQLPRRRYKGWRHASGPGDPGQAHRPAACSTKRRRLLVSTGFSSRWFGTFSRNARAEAVKAPPLMNTTLSARGRSVLSSSA